jgi:cell division protein FtsN
MPKDFKNNPAPRSDNRRSGHPMLVGILIGLLLGIVIALGVALWLNRLSNPFIEKARTVEPLPRIAPAPATKSEGKAAAEKSAEKSGAEKPRFEFYTMLPGEKEVSPPRESKAEKPHEQARDAPKEAPKTGPGSPSQPKPHTGETYWLQAGAFADEKDADNLKAKIALSGLEASVKAADIPNKGVLYRVRLGPYQSIEDANRIKASLSSGGIGAAIIRADEAKNR